MKRQLRLSTYYYWRELFTLLGFFIISVGFIFFFRAEERRLYNDKTEESFTHYNQHIDYSLAINKQIFLIALQNPGTSEYEAVDFLQDFVKLDNDFRITEIFHQNSEKNYSYDIIGLNEESQMETTDLEPYNIMILGPTVSQLSGNLVFPYIYPVADGYYLWELEANEYFLNINDLFTKVWEYYYFFVDPEGNIICIDKSWCAGNVSNYISNDLWDNEYHYFTTYNNSLGKDFYIVYKLKAKLVHTVYVGVFLIILLFFLTTLYVYFFYSQSYYLFRPIQQMEVALDSEDAVELFAEMKGFELKEIDELHSKIKAILTRLFQEQIMEQEIKDFYQSILNSSPNLIVVSDNEGTVEMMNLTARSFFSQFDYVREKVNISELFNLTDQEIEEIGKLLLPKNKKSCFLEKIITRKNIDFTFALSVYPIEREDAKWHLVFMLIDTTEKAKIEREFSRARKLETVGVLAAGFAHDFNNLLTVMMGNLDVYRYAKTDKKKEEIMYDIQGAVIKAAELVKQIQVFTQHEKQEMFLIRVDEQIRRIVKMSSKILTDDILLSMDSNKEEIHIMGNPNLFMQIFLNLIFNARDAIQDKKSQLSKEYEGRIEILIKSLYIDEDKKDLLILPTTGDYVQVSVSDNGIGVASENKDRLFDPFFSTKNRGPIKGTGLGLSIVYGAVQSFGGAIEMTSVLGEGSTFHVYLPIKNKTEEDPHFTFEKSAANNTCHILIVDDDPAIRKLGAEFLEVLNYRPSTATNGKEAIDILKKSKTDLVILDMEMPEFDGYYFIEHYEKEEFDIPVLISTGYADKYSPEDFSGYTFMKGFLNKPFSLDKFSEKLREILT